MNIEIPIPDVTKPKLFGGFDVCAYLYYKIFKGDKTGQIDQYQVYDYNLDDWVCVDLTKLKDSKIDDLQKTIDKHVLENPEIFEKEGA